MSDNPYLSTAEAANATHRSPLAPRAAWCAIASWVIVFLQGVCFLVAVAIARSGAREIGAYLLYAVPVLGVASVFTTLAACVLVGKCWFREEPRTKHFYLAHVLSLLHGMLLVFVAFVLVAAAFAR